MTLLERATALIDEYDIRLAINADVPLEVGEPNHFVVEYRCSIRLSKFDRESLETDEEEITAGNIDLHRVQFTRNLNEGYGDGSAASRFDILDAHSANLAEYIPLLGASGESYWTDEVADATGDDVEMCCDLLVLEQADIDVEFRGRGLGLLAARRLISIIDPDYEALLAFRPWPTRTRRKANGIIEVETFPDCDTPDFEAARKKLDLYWSRLGAEQVAGTDIWVLCPLLTGPTFEEVFTEDWPRQKRSDSERRKERHKHKRPRSGKERSGALAAN